jgi:hypothetical protein
MRNNFTIKEVLGYGWEMTKKHFWVFAGALLLSFAIGMMFGFIDTMINPIPEGELYAPFSISSLLINIVSMAISFIISFNLLKMVFAAIDGHMVKFADIFQSIDAKRFVNWIVAALVYGMAVGLGFILFIIPGIYIAVRFMFVQYLILDKNMGIKEAFAMSTEMTEGIKWNLIGLSIASGLLCLAGLILLLVGFIPASITVYFAVAYLYRKLYAANIG